MKKELTVETLEELMKGKAVREKKQEMEKKLETLRKKHEKVCFLYCLLWKYGIYYCFLIVELKFILGEKPTASSTHLSRF